MRIDGRPRWARIPFERIAYLECIAVAALAIGSALHNGLVVGISNHCQYLLHGLHDADPSFLEGDWFVTRTPDHHAPFSLLVQFCARWGVLNVALGLANAGSSIAFALAIYFIVARFTERPLLPFVATMALAAFIRPDGPGHSNLLLPYFVPSVFAGAAQLCAFGMILHGRPRAAGITSAMAGAMHANFMLLSLPFWVCYIVLLPRSERARAARQLLIPWAVSVLPHVSVLMTIFRDTGPVEEARRIFWQVYAPMHYHPSTWPPAQWIDFLAILGAGLASSLCLRCDQGRNALRLVVALLLVVGGGAAAILIANNAIATALFPWRFAPFLTVAAFIAIGLTLDPAGPFSWRQSILAPVVSMAAISITRMDQRSLILFAGCWVVFILVRAFRRSAQSQWIDPIGRCAVLATVAVLALLAARSGLWRRDMFTHRTKPETASLFEWCRESTPPGTVFAIPPDLVDFRLATGRAIVVDFKSFPFTPSDQIEWMRRIRAVTGGDVAGYDEAVAAYSLMDAPRARSLAQDFGAEYLVTDGASALSGVLGQALVFENRRYRVFRIGSGRSQD